MDSLWTGNFGLATLQFNETPRRLSKTASAEPRPLGLAYTEPEWHVAQLDEHRIAWSGFIGAPGVSTFYSLSAGSASQTAVRAFYNSIASALPSVVTVTFPSGGRIIDTDSHEAVGTWVDPSPPLPVTGTGGTGYAAPTGAVVNWLTGVFNAGRELRGKTFLVPLTNAAFDIQGNIASATLTQLRSAATTLVGAWTDMRIYSRSTGSIGAVTTATVPDFAAVLRSRRD